MSKTDIPNFGNTLLIGLKSCPVSLFRNAELIKIVL